MLFGEMETQIMFDLEWLKTESPLWVIYALVIYGVIRYIPKLFEKHCLMLDTATDSMAKSASAISNIQESMSDGAKIVADNHKTIIRAAVPACRALASMAGVDSKPEVQRHLDQVLAILEKSERDEKNENHRDKSL